MISVHARLRYDVAANTSFLFNVEAARSRRQRIDREELLVDPPVGLRRIEDHNGNRLLIASAEPGQFELAYDAEVSLEHFVPGSPPAEIAFEELPGEAYAYLRPSRYCQSDLLLRLAGRLFGDLPDGAGRVQTICDWVHQHLDYVPGSTDASSTALDVLHGGAGVCRDFAHLSIALCRATGIPARYVSGYAVDLDPPDFHGFFEAFLDNRWFLFDATKMSNVDQLVRIGTGRDAGDVAFVSYIGDVQLLELEVSATAASDTGPTPATVSTSGAADHGPSDQS